MENVNLLLYFANRNNNETLYKDKVKFYIMKKTIIFLTLVIVALVCRLNQQKEIIDNLGTQVTQQEQVFEKVLNQVEQDNPNYVTDVLSETDTYQDYIDLMRF